MVWAANSLMISINEGWGERNRPPCRTAAGRRILPAGGPGIPAWTDACVRNHRRKPVLVFTRVPLVLLMMVTLLFGLFSVRAGEAAASEAQVKAAFLLHFPKYVDWPANAFPETNSPVVVGVLGDEDVADEFSAMSAGKVIDGHPIRLIRAPTIAQCSHCHIVFIGMRERRGWAGLLSKAAGLKVLTVGESNGFLGEGGMINLARYERRISLEVNLDSIRRSDLKLSSRLLAIATVEGEKK
jgi:hypothetical protein